MLRAFLGFVYATVFFIGAVLLMSVTIHISTGGGEASKVANERAAQQFSVPIFFGSIALAWVGCWLRLLPGTRERAAKEPVYHAPAARAPDTAPRDAVPRGRPPVDPEIIEQATAAWTKEEYGYTSSRVPSSSKATVLPDASEGGHVSEHPFSLGGFMEEWKLIAPGAVVMGLIGFCMLGALPGKAKGEGVVWVGLALLVLGSAIPAYMAYRFLAIRWVRLDDEGVTWGGVFGNEHHDWDEIVEVYRAETVVVNRNARSKSMHLKFADGSKVRFDQALAGFDDLAGSIQMTTADLIFRRKIDEFTQQGQAGFGPVTVTKNGVEMQGEFFAWTELGNHRIENGHLVLYKLGRGRRDRGNKETKLAEIPNYMVLLTFMDSRGMPK